MCLAHSSAFGVAALSLMTMSVIRLLCSACPHERKRGLSDAYGLALLYGFNRSEALRSFRKASELDPAAAMPYWGMAMATGPYINMGAEGDGDLDSKAACAAAASGLKVAATSARERAYLEAATARCPEYKPDAYAAAMKRLTEQYPDDLDAATFYAESLMVPVRWHWYSSDGKAAPGVEEAERTLEQVLRRWPAHPGANHYYI